MEKQRKRLTRYNLITGEDTYASQTAQNPITARKVNAFIPSAAGDLRRQRPFPKYLNSQLPATVLWLHQFDKVDSVGVFTSHFFAATASALYKETAGAWVQVSAVGALTGVPMAVNINNLMHFSDGSVNWIFDGTNWIRDGLPISLVQPMTSQDFKKPNSASGTNWNNPTNILLDDDTYADYTNTTQDDLKVTDFRILVPAGETIKGIEVVVRGHGDDATAANRQIDVGLTKDGSALAGTRKTAQQLDQDIDNTLTLGGETDLWGTTWSVAEVTASTFGVLIRDADVNAHKLNLDSAEVRVHWGSGKLTVVTNRYYWTTDADQTTAIPERFHESTSSPKSQGTGALTNRKVRVYQQQGTVSTTSGLNTLTGKGTSFGSQHVGMKIYVDGTDFGTIATVTDSTTATLTTNAPSTKTDVHFTILDARCTHWYIYASEAESSNIGLKLAEVAAATNFYDDDSPFADDPSSLFTNLERPTRNDPAPLSKILAVHKERIFRRRETAPRFFNYTASEEIDSASGSPEECVPGTDDANTLSDIVNETPFPDESDEIRNLTSHGDALYIGTEDEGLPMYGDGREDFALSPVTAFKVGMAGRFAADSTSYGLAFMQYDRELLLYPSQSPPPSDGDFTEALIEIGRPQNAKFALIDPTDLDGVHVLYWRRQEWLVVAYKDNTGTYHTVVFDFKIRAWWEMSQGFASLGVFEVSSGNRVLVGGSSDGFVYVLDDPDGTYSIAGLSYPQASFRPALIDFGDPENASVFRYFEYEVDDDTVAITVNYWLDPVDVDNPGDPTELPMSLVPGSANRFRGYPIGGGYCNRLLLEVLVTDTGLPVTLRGIVVVADPASNLAR